MKVKFLPSILDAWRNPYKSTKVLPCNQSSSWSFFCFKYTLNFEQMYAYATVKPSSNVGDTHVNP